MSMFQRIFGAKCLQRITCVLLAVVMLVGLFSGGGFATEFGSIVPFANPIEFGNVGPSLPFSQTGLAPWTLYDDGTVVIGGGVVRGISFGPAPPSQPTTVWQDESQTSPWNSYRNIVTHIVFTEPVEALGNLSGLFANLPYLTTIDGLEYFNIDTTVGNNVWMSHMFRGSSSLATLDISNWDVRNVVRFSSMFRGASSLTSLDLSTWDMSRAVRLDSMFRDTNLTALIGLDNWNTENVQWMQFMFADAIGLTTLDLSAWNTSSVTTFDSMFRDAIDFTSLNLSTWDTSSATTFFSMFRDASSLEEIVGIEDFNTDSAILMAHMFRGASSLESLDLSAWNTSNVRSGEGFGSMFRDMSSLTTLDLGGWNTITASAVQMVNMFAGSPNLRQLTLGSGWSVAPGATPNLTPSQTPRYTSEWQNSPTATVPSLVNSPGLRYYSPGTLMTGTTGAPLPTESNPITWYWRRAVRTVTFLSGSDGTIAPAPPVSELIFSGDTLAETGISIPTPQPVLVPAPGFKFAYWEDQNGVQFPPDQLQDLLDLPITENKTFTAIFVDSTAIPVIFDLNSGLYGGYPYPVTLWVLPGDTISQANISIPVPTRPGWVLTGWREDGTGNLMNATQVGAEIVAAGTVSRTFVAQWVPADTGGGNGGGTPNIAHTRAAGVPDRHRWADSSERQHYKSGSGYDFLPAHYRQCPRQLLDAAEPLLRRRFAELVQ